MPEPSALTAGEGPYAEVTLALQAATDIARTAKPTPARPPWHTDSSHDPTGLMDLLLPG